MFGIFLIYLEYVFPINYELYFDYKIHLIYEFYKVAGEDPQQQQFSNL